MTFRILLIALAASLLACTPNSSEPLVATHVELTSPRPGSPMRAGYMRLSNHSDSTIRITAVSSPAFGRVELHETVIDNEIARMRPVKELVIDPGSDVRLQPGGLHLMLMRPLAEGGDRGTLTLEFFDEQNLVLSVTAKQSGESDTIAPGQ